MKIAGQEVDASSKNIQIQEGFILDCLRFSIEFSIYIKMSKKGLENIWMPSSFMMHDLEGHVLLT